MSIGLYNVDTQHRTVERIRTKAAIIDDGQSWTEELYKLTKTQRERTRCFRINAIHVSKTVFEYGLFLYFRFLQQRPTHLRVFLFLYARV